jgi:TonB family protein
VALPVWLNNLIAYTLQIAILASAGTLLAYLFRLRVPRVALCYWQLLLVGCMLLPCLQPWAHPRIISSVTVAQSAVVPIAAVSEIVTAEPLKSPKPVLWKYIPHILGGGIALRLLWLAIGFLRLSLFRRKSQLFSEERTIIQDMQWRTGVRVTVLLSPAIHSPVTFGFRSPVIILPLSFINLSESCKQAVLCHELMHVRRYDWIVILAEEIIRSMFWFHPAVWWLLNRIRLSREQAVDHEVVQLIGNKEPYLNSLLEFARTHQRLQTVPAPLFLSERHLVQRVALLLKEVSMSRTRIAFSMTGISALLLATLYLATGWFPLTGDPILAQDLVQAPMAEQPQVKSSTPERPQIAGLQILPAMAPPAALAAAAAPQQEAETEIQAPRRNPIRIGGNVMESKLIYKVNPEYPALARMAHVEGSVMLMATINEEGLVSDAKVMEGNPMLVDSAIQTVKQWKYSPTMIDGTPVPVMATVTVIYKMMNSDNLAVLMDDSGHVSADLDKLLQTKGTVVLTIPPQTPYKVADDAIQGLLSKGVQRIQVSGAYALYQGKLYYAGPFDRPTQFAMNSDAIVNAFAAVMKETQEKTIRFNYRVFISETGDVVGLQQMGSDSYPEFENAVMRSHVEPTLLNGVPVPYARTFTHYNIP